MTSSVLLLSCTFENLEKLKAGSQWRRWTVGVMSTHKGSQPCPQGDPRHSCHLENWKEVDQCQKEDGAVGFNLTRFANVTLEHKGREEKMLLYAGIYFCHPVREKLQPWGHWSCAELPKTLTCKLPSLERVILLVHENRKNQFLSLTVPGSRPVLGLVRASDGALGNGPERLELG